MQLLALLLLGCWAFIASSIPLSPESGGGIAPWAGKGPKPKARPSKKPSPKEDAPSRATVAASSVPVGSIIRSCTQPGTFAITFDDGPYIYTSQILDLLKNSNVPATFFVNGNNWESILTENSQALVRRMIAEGHQIGSHTWAHPDLTTLDRNGIVSEMTLLEDALISIVGNYPTYMRPPYFATNDLVLRTMGELNYHVVNADIDTFDWQNNTPERIQTSVQLFRDGLNAGGTIVLSHDVHETTANTLTQIMIDEVQNKGLRAVTVGDCLGDPKENWYRTR